jgi:hypothetical protein
MVLEDKVAMRFSAIKKTYAIGAHLEPTKGSKQQATKGTRMMKKVKL